MKAVVIMSGGIDSTTLLYKVQRDYKDVTAVTFDYGQTHKVELESAKEIARIAQVTTHYMYRIPKLLGSALTGMGFIPKEDYSVETQKVTVVPNRNMVFLSFAVNIALARGASDVFYGAHANDQAIYPDCRAPFVRAIQMAVDLGNYEHVNIQAPFLNMKKWEIVKLGEELGVPFEKTWSCYDPMWVYGDPAHCGICGTCRERKMAFEEAGVHDPTDYWK